MREKTLDVRVTTDDWRPLLGLKEPLPTALNLAREAFMEHVRPVLRSFDLSEQQWRVLRALHLLGELDAAELANSASLRKSSLSRIIKELSDRKLLIRIRDKNDGRRVKIKLTNSGGKICNLLGPEMERNHIETVALLNGVDIDLLSRELAKLTEILEAKLKSD